MTRYATWRGEPGSLLPEDRARVDRAIEASDSLEGAIVGVVTERELAEAAVAEARQAALDTANAVGPVLAETIRAGVETEAGRAELAAAAVSDTKARLDSLGDATVDDPDEGISLIEFLNRRRALSILDDGLYGVFSGRMITDLAARLAPLIGGDGGGGVASPVADGWAAQIEGEVVTFSANAGLGRVDRFRLLNSVRLPTPRRAIVMVHYGQSNSGVRAMAEPLIWAASPAPYHVLTLNDRNGTTVASNLGGMEGWGGALPNAVATAVIPAVEYDQQTVVGAAAARLVDLWSEPAAPVVICGAAGHDGQAFYGTGAVNSGLHFVSTPVREAGVIVPETRPALSRTFNNFITRISQMVTFGRAAGLTVDRVYIPFTHQEAESQLLRSEYLRRWMEFKAEAEAAIAAAVSGVSVTWLVDQGGGTTAAATGNAWQPRMSIYDATLPANGGANVVMVQPRYWLQLGMDVNNPTQPDPIHHSYGARILQGEVMAYCIRELEAGRKWRCAWPASVTVAGSTITIDFDSLLPLTIDRSFIPVRPDLGFELRGTTATITSVTQTDARRIVVQCSASPAAGFLRYAYHTSAGEPWNSYTTGTGALREIWSAESRFLGGQMLYRPALGFEWGL